MSYLYLDLLDTTRGRADHPFRQSVDTDGTLATRTLMLELLMGNVIVLSQNHAFDSTVLLDAAVAAESGSFLEMVRQRRIRFAIKAASVMAAFESALDNQMFLLSAWPSLDGNAGLRIALKEALRTGRATSDFGDMDQRKIEGVFRLADAIASTQQLKAGSPASPSLS